MKKLLIILSMSLCLSGISNAQTQQDTIYNYLTTTPVTIDGMDMEACWDHENWVAIDQVWIPYNGAMSDGDFEGRFKVAWDAEYLYLLVEVVDNMISDDHSNPLDSWWEDDCLEIFIDEDRSKGNHERSTNAFAYHVSTLYDAIDLNSSGGGINYKDHVEVVMNEMGNNIYMWEVAIKIYADDYDHSNPEASRVTLTHNKVMGFTMAYCDNDETTGRENFIGSMIMSQATANDNYITANYFGTMLLVDPDYDPVSAENREKSRWQVYPVPSGNVLNIIAGEEDLSQKSVVLTTITGQTVKSTLFSDHTCQFDVSDLCPGMYMLSINSAGGRHTRCVIIE